MVTLHEATSLQNNANGFTVRRKGQNPIILTILKHTMQLNLCNAIADSGSNNALQYGTLTENRTPITRMKIWRPNR